SRLGAAASFGARQAPDAGDALAAARAKVFGAETRAEALKRMALRGATLPHWFTFDLLDAGIRLELFKQLTAQGYSDRAAADEIQRALVDYGDTRRGEHGQPLSRAIYTLPYLRGAAKAVAAAWRRNPVAAWLLWGALYGGGGLAALGIAGYEQRRNEAATGHAMAANPAGVRDRYGVGVGPTGLPEFRRLTTPMGVYTDAARAPASYLWNRLDPSVRTAAEIATGEHQPLNSLLSVPWGPGGRTDTWAVLPAADAAAWEAGDRGPALADYARVAASEEVGGPVSDVSGAMSGKRALADLLAPVTTRALDPYTAVYADLQAAQATEAQARRAQESGTLTPALRQRYARELTTALRRGLHDAMYAAAAYRAHRPPPAKAARVARDLESDYRALAGIAGRTGLSAAVMR
ncbi:MAG: hypothetical protein ACRD1M_06875, partial [Terriglobales bacterium]